MLSVLAFCCFVCHVTRRNRRNIFLQIFTRNFVTNFKTKMIETLYSVPFMLFEVPNLKLKKPSWFQQPSAMTVFSFVLLSYFLVTGGRFVEGWWVGVLGCVMFNRLILVCFRYHLRRDRWTSERWFDDGRTWPLPAGGVHAVQGEWPVHYGGPCQQLPLYDRRAWLYHHGSNAHPGQAEAEQDSAHRDGLHLHSGVNVNDG